MEATSAELAGRPKKIPQVPFSAKTASDTDHYPPYSALQVRGREAKVEEGWGPEPLRREVPHLQ